MLKKTCQFHQWSYWTTQKQTARRGNSEPRHPSCKVLRASSRMADAEVAENFLFLGTMRPYLEPEVKMRWVVNDVLWFLPFCVVLCVCVCPSRLLWIKTKNRCDTLLLQQLCCLASPLLDAPFCKFKRDLPSSTWHLHQHVNTESYIEIGGQEGGRGLWGPLSLCGKPVFREYGGAKKPWKPLQAGRQLGGRQLSLKWSAAKELSRGASEPSEADSSASLGSVSHSSHKRSSSERRKNKMPRPLTDLIHLHKQNQLTSCLLMKALTAKQSRRTSISLHATWRL